MTLKAQQQNSSSFFQQRRLIAFTLASLFGTTSTLSGTVLLWLIDSRAVLGASVSQTGEDLPASGQNLSDRAQLPILPPPPEPIDSPAPNPVPVPPEPSFNSDTLNPEGVNPYASPPPLGYPEQQREAVPADQFRLYRLGIGDSIAVAVPRFPDLGFQGTINLEGEIVVPLVGKLKLVGLTIDGAEQVIRQSLNRFVVDPEVVVALTGTRPAQVTISGEVFRPGYYTLPPGALLSAALQTAGGTTNEADLRTVVVRRRSLVDNSFSEQQIDLFTPLQNGTNLPDFRLQDGDAVVISRLEVATAQDYDRGLVSRSSVAQPQISIRVLSYANQRIGNVTLPNGSTFVDALVAIAPNPDQVKLRDVALVRFDPESGKAVTQRLNGRSALLGDVSQNIPLQDNDVIVVGRNLVARLTYALDVVTRPIRTIFGFQQLIDDISNVLGGDENDD